MKKQTRILISLGSIFGVAALMPMAASCTHTNNDELNKKIESLEKQLNEAKANSQKDQAQINDLMKQLQETKNNSKTIEEKEKLVKKLQEDLNKIQQERTAKYQTELNAANKAIVEIPNKYKELEQKNDDLKDQLENLSKELVPSRMQSRSLEGKIKTSSEKAKQLEQELTKNETDLGGLKSQLDKLNEDLKALNKANTDGSKNAEIEAKYKDIDAQNLKIKTAEEKNNKLQKELKTKKDEIIKKTSEKSKLDLKIAELETNKNKVSEQIDANKKELEALNKEYADSVKKSDELSKLLSKENDNSPASQEAAARHILELKDDLENELENAKLDDISAPTAEQSKKISEIYGKYIEKISKINDASLTSDSLAWKYAIKYDWEIAKGHHDNQLRLLNPTFFYGNASVYPMNAFSNQYGKYGQLPYKQLLANFKEAVQHKIVMSKVYSKMVVNAFVGRLFQEELTKFVEDKSKNEISVADLIESSSLEGNWKEFLKYYATTYYNAATHGLGEDIKELKLYKENKTNEKELSIDARDKGGKIVKLYGLGLTEKDLNQRNVGLGFAEGDATVNGQSMYRQILKMATTSDLTDDQVNNIGYETTKKSAENSKKIANQAADLIVGKGKKWEAKIKYDADGIGPEEIKEETVVIRDEKGNIDIPSFTKWLNDEEFFFGREGSAYWTDTIKNGLKTDLNLKKYVGELTKFDYDQLLTKGNKDAKHGSITNEEFYYGGLSAFKAYEQFKKTTQNYGRKFFANEVPDYDIQTYKFNEREFVGVGAYNSGIKKFMFNVDPYFSLPKWSVTSFANHESMMGHHNQLMYAQKYLSSVGEFGKYKLGNVFHYTSYVEGWALFMEWFGIEAGFYGTPDYDNKDGDLYAMPVDFSTAHGITNFFTAKTEAEVTDDMIQQIKDLHNGVYWNKVAQVNKYENQDKKHAMDAVKLANLLQYQGALNEAQLRNMRLALDTAYHGKGVKGHEDLPAGASINQVREFMKKNSSLGIGDITSESRRYLSYVGQATSYNSGKAVMMDLYTKVQKKLGLTRREFVEKDNHKYVKEFFDALLRNSALPMDALIKSVSAKYGLTVEKK
uniref:Membrane protein n=2 Tax=Metamycoplasma hominis TaxID=2098 RepID=Q49555_METHO|nr:membrane protein [Metamycoplasma hominis]